MVESLRSAPAPGRDLALASTMNQLDVARSRGDVPRDATFVSYRDPHRLQGLGEHDRVYVVGPRLLDVDHEVLLRIAATLERSRATRIDVTT